MSKTTLASLPLSACFRITTRCVMMQFTEAALAFKGTVVSTPADCYSIRRQEAAVGLLTW